MKKFLLTLSILCNFALAEDYTLGNTNPFAKYQYKPEVKEQVNNYQDPNINYAENSNIKLIPPNITKKYENLLNTETKIGTCWDSAARAYKIDPWMLMAIAKVESNFNKNAHNVNKNKSIDVGYMQINSIWFPTLRKFGIQGRDLLNPCTSIYVGAWIFAQNIQQFGYNQDGIGAYNSPGNVPIRRRYAKKVYSAYNELMRDFAPYIQRLNQGRIAQK